MFLGQRIKELREEKGLLQRELAAKLEIDSPMFSKIERGERKAKREHIEKLAILLDADQAELIKLWLAGQVYELVKDEATSLSAIKLVEKYIAHQ